jgi:hypothetical protein
MPSLPKPAIESAARPRRKSPPYPFLIESLATAHPEIRPMFSGYAVYIGDKIVLMLRDSPKAPEDNGLWLVFAEDFDESRDPKTLRREFPSLRPIQLLGGAIKHWLLLPSDGPDFESESLHACDLLLAHDPRLGRIPQSRKSKTVKGSHPRNKTSK